MRAENLCAHPCANRKRCHDVTLSRQEANTYAPPGECNPRPAGQYACIRDDFFCHLAGRSAPTGLAIVHWIGCINAIKLCFCIFGKNLKIQNGCHF